MSVISVLDVGVRFNIYTAADNSSGHRLAATWWLFRVGVYEAVCSNWILRFISKPVKAWYEDFSPSVQRNVMCC